MTMLLKEPDAPVGEPATEPPAPARACDTCGAEMADGQDWCLSCGTAAPGRLGTRPGMRAATTIVAITLLLAGGAVAASYAALSDDAQREASRPAPPDATPVAAAPQATVPAVTPPPTATTPGATTPGVTTPVIPPTATTPGITTPTLPTIQTPRIPKITAPTTSIPTTTPRVTPTVTPKTTTPKSTTPAKKNTSSTASSNVIALPADSLALYDPYNRAKEKTDPADAYDDKTDTAFSITTEPGQKMGLGLVIDLESAKAVKVLELVTNTPGFRAEVYGATGSQRPPDILDTRWAHIKDRSRVDETKIEGNKPGDGRERIVLGGGGKSYRFFAIWLTTPPDAGTVVRFQDLKLLG
jgi:hypothetical protein